MISKSGKRQARLSFFTVASFASILIATLAALPALVQSESLEIRSGQTPETPPSEIQEAATEQEPLPVPASRGKENRIPPEVEAFLKTLPWPGDPDYQPLDPAPPLPPPPKSYLESAEMGRVLFYTKGCITCHSILGQGGEVGPDLSGVGLRRSFEWLKQLIKAPQSLQPDSIMGIYIRDDWEVEALARYLAYQRMTVTIPPSEYEYVRAQGIPIPYPPPERPLWKQLEEKQGIKLPPPQIPPSPPKKVHALDGEGKK